MASNIDHIDLNSEVVADDPEGDVGKDVETLAGGGGQGEEIVNSEVGNASKEVGKEGISVVEGSRLGFLDAERVESADVAKEDDTDEMEMDNKDDNLEGTTTAVDVAVSEESDSGDSGDSDEVDSGEDSEPYVGEERNMNVGEVTGKEEFGVPDLVWGKVRSHPWWPGQIFDNSDASKKAKKYLKKGYYLIAYFGDQTFAWNDVSKIKPFRSHFSKMEKQSNLEEFHYAIDCVLDEVSRRVEYHLACSCVPDYNNIKTQVIVNAGIREESCRRDGGDRFSDAASFRPATLIEYVRELGQMPLAGVDRLEFVTVHAQLLAFNRWKGYSFLPEIQFLEPWLETKAEEPQLVEVEHGREVNENMSKEVEESAQVVKHESSDDEYVPSEEEKSKSQNGASHKPKHITGSSGYPSKKEKSLAESSDDEYVPSEEEKSKSQNGGSHKRKHITGSSGYPSKKEKSLADMLAEKRLRVANNRSSLEGKGTGKMNSAPSGKKRKAAGSPSGDSVVKERKVEFSSPGNDESTQPRKSTFSVGNSILRVASQLNGQTPILKACNTQKPAVKSKSQEKSVPRKSEGKTLFREDDLSSNKMMSKLCLVSRNPKKSNNFLNSLISSFAQFRNSICLDRLGSHLVEQSSPGNVSSGNVVEESTKTGTEIPESATATPITCEGVSSVDDETEAEKCLPETPKEKSTPMEPQSAVQLSPSSDCDDRQSIDGVVSLEAGKPVEHLEKNDNNDSGPTALILSFTDLDSIPSETKLNEIFSRFGPLKESETEILKKSSRAKVVFCKSADAEAAFRSPGKYGIFGPSLLNYRIQYATSTPKKSSTMGTKQPKKAARSVGGNTQNNV